MNWNSFLQTLSVSMPARQAYALAVRVPVIRTVVRTLSRGAIPPGSRIWVDIRGGLGKGLALNLDPRFETQYAIGDYELHLQRALSAHLMPGSVVYDVGAHIGVVSMFASQLVGSTGAVFAFEADPENTNRIKAHLERNDLRQIEAVQCAVWSSSGPLRFERASAESSRNQGSIAAASEPTSQNTIIVEAITLDEFAIRHRPPTLIKIDVEGGEAEVLRGCAQIFSRSRPVVICEVHHRQAEDSVRHWLAERGYAFEWLTDGSKFPRHLLAVQRDELRTD